MATAGVCPHCGQLDAVRKVRAIVTEGVSVGHYQSIVPLQWQGKTYYLPAQRETTSSTLLAQRLAPPSQPKKPKKDDYSYMKYASASFKAKYYLIVVLLPVLLSWIAFCGIAGVGSLVIEGAGGWVLATLIWIGIVIGGAIPSVLWAKKARKNAEFLRWQALAERDYNWALRQYEMWLEAMQRWNELYYCARCDGVFLEGSRLVPVEQMYSFLYE
jgi:hypothetical protein